MNIFALIFTILGATAAVFYGIEAFQIFRAAGFASPIHIKLSFFVLGVFLFFFNARRIKAGSSSRTNAA